ncbi:glutaredoxin family protein, partial [Pandoraea pneumonica]
MNGSERRSHELVLLTKPGCHLCQAARETVESVAGELGVSWEEKNI